VVAKAAEGRLSAHLSIYIKKKVCLSVRYAFSPCDTYGRETFHGTCLGPEEGRRLLFFWKKMNPTLATGNL
jgi:hypothetical protein